MLADGHRLGVAMMSMNAAEALYPDTTGATNELTLDRTAQLFVPVVFAFLHGRRNKGPETLQA